MDYIVDCKESTHHLTNIIKIEYIDSGVIFKGAWDETILYVSHEEINYFTVNKDGAK